jgi:hypothetical protein
MDAEFIVRTLRTQAWERAKAELKSMEATYYKAVDGEAKFLDFTGLVADFVRAVESEGLQE